MENVSISITTPHSRPDRKSMAATCCSIISNFFHYIFVVPFKIILCILSLLETSACLWFILICMPTILISPVLYRKIVDFFVEEFCKFTVQLFCLSSRAKLKLSGVAIDKITSSRSNLFREALWPVFICNHKTQVDMLAAWMLLYKLNIPCNVIKFMAASYTRYVPGYGCGLQVMRSIFLSRQNTERDLQQIRDIMAFHAFYGIPKGILLYPEGTTHFKESLEATNKFAAKNNLPPRKYSLYPRHKGLYELLQAMRNVSALNELYDLTVGYEELRGSDDDFTIGRMFFKGPVQRKYHIHVEKYDAVTLSEYNETELKDWIFDLYDEKEKRLAHFETHEPPCLNYSQSDAVQDASFTLYEHFAGFARIVWHLFLVVLIFVLPWYYIRFYRIHEYVGFICYPVALIALTILGFFIGLDRLERWLERVHLIIICWPLIQWKADYIPCVHSNKEHGSGNVSFGDQNDETENAPGVLGGRFFGSITDNAVLRLSERISLWTARFDISSNSTFGPGTDNASSANQSSPSPPAEVSASQLIAPSNSTSLGLSLSSGSAAKTNSEEEIPIMSFANKKSNSTFAAQTEA